MRDICLQKVQAELFVEHSGFLFCNGRCSEKVKTFVSWHASAVSTVVVLSSARTVEWSAGSVDHNDSTCLLGLCKTFPYSRLHITENVSRMFWQDFSLKCLYCKAYYMLRAVLYKVFHRTLLFTGSSCALFSVTVQINEFMSTSL